MVKQFCGLAEEFVDGVAVAVDGLGRRGGFDRRLWWSRRLMRWFNLNFRRGVGRVLDETVGDCGT